MKKYDSYKNSGIEWIGEIPSHWNVMKFGYLFNFSRGLGITKQDLLDEGVPCVNYGEIHSKYGFRVDPEINKLKCVQESYLESSDKSLLRRGDFVFADTSEDIEGSGNFTCLDSDTPIFAGYHTVIARGLSENSYIFLAYYFDSLEYRNQIRNSVSGIKVYSITQGILKNTSVLLPPPTEQTAIAKYLDRKTAEIDELIADKKRLVELYEEEKTAIINQAVTKGINPDAPMKDSGIEWMEEIPEHWELKKLKLLVSKIGSGVTPSGGSSVYQTSGIPLLRSQNIHFDGLKLDDVAYISEEIDEGMSNSRIQENDVLLNITGASIGRCFYVPVGFGRGNVNQHVCILRPIIEKIHVQFLYYQMRSIVGQIQINLQQTGANREGLNFEQLKNFQIPYPATIHEQVAIVNYLKSATALIDNKKSRTEKLIDLLTEYRTALISEVVTGKIKVTE